ncbi:hypothetical protein QN372_17030 [Undibacterium sp. RTI2.1]|nr:MULTISPECIES: hypothetical protein [unclassified Undibacterium]MDY7537893.1 hypothetical protein [Undibacterium sp. 5I1]MEB0032458.1 hypothetical protein [Undibacterium sp. RTI2.1]MEB0118770.1 hypothetical protein [Undibacterium sp. RTI2.2]MEB0232691.1 hypothetical protein [Undibacterium sp. 10I3]MEB0259645.1 hypothetical protein [Undibacterium sp. 5I1]
MVIIYLSHVEQFCLKPMLELEGWERQRNLNNLVFVDYWGSGDAAASSSH